ncbi:MAG: PEP-CTERM sorting domain-containing protein [Sedimentisphaerales bacterium]
MKKESTIRDSFRSFRINLVFLAFVLLLIVEPFISDSLLAVPFTLVDNDTLGFYNDSLGTTLDRTNPYRGTFLFPGANVADGDPTINGAPEPILVSADSILGPWLNNPPVLNANWNDPQTIPMTWAINTETAIIYNIDGGQSGIQDVVAHIGVDNGVYIWLDGIYQFGALAPGPVIEFEYNVPLPDLGPGTHYLQVLREDHGGTDGFSIQVTGVPEPATICLLGVGVFGLIRRKR